MGAALHLVALESINAGAHIGGHLVVHLVAGVGDAVVHPEGRGGRIVQTVSVAHAEAIGHLGGAGVDGSEVGGGCIVGTEPEDAAHYVGNVVTGLAHHPETGLLGGDGTLVKISLAFHGELHGTPAVREGVAACPNVLGHIHGGSLKVVSHYIGHVLHAGLLAGEYEQGHIGLQVSSHYIVQIGVGVTGDGVAVLVVEREPAVREDVEGAPNAGVAAAHGAKICRAVGLLEAEFFVQALEITFAAGKGDNIRSIEAVLRVLEGEFADAGLVGMGADGAVRHAHGHPNDALLRVHAVAHVGALADELHNPGFVLVGDGEGFSLGGITVLVGQVHNYVNGLAGGFGALQGNVNEGTVVYAAGFVFQFGTAAPGGFGNDYLELVHVAHRLIGVGNLLNNAQGLVGVPVVNLDGAARFPVAGGSVVQLSVEGVGICGIGNQYGTVLAGTPADNHIGAGAGLHGKEQGHRGHQCFQERISHRIWAFSIYCVILSFDFILQSYENLSFIEPCPVIWPVAFYRKGTKSEHESRRKGEAHSRIRR